MRRILIFAGAAAFVAIVIIVVARTHDAPAILGVSVALGLGAGVGSSWARAGRSYRDWRGASAAVPRLRRDVVAKVRSLGAALVGVGLAVALILAIMRGK